MRISSVHNKKILALRKLYKSRERKASGVFIAEGVKEVTRGISSDFEIQALYYSPGIFKGGIEDIVENTHYEFPVFEVDEPVYKKIAYRDNTEGLLAVFKKKIFTIGDFEVGENSLFIVLESVEKPGNLGAVLRTADAAGVDAVILTESKVNQYHPNVIRSSIGAAFTVPVIITDNNSLLQWFKANGIKSYAAVLPAYKSLYELDARGKIAFVFGTESEGLSDFWFDNADEKYTIPMSGIVDSLNVSVSVAISIFEAKRQRG